MRLALEKMEQDLSGRDWLAPGGVSLGDIAVYPYANYLPRLEPELMAGAPRTRDWLERMSARPAVKAAEDIVTAPTARAIAEKLAAVLPRSGMPTAPRMPKPRSVKLRPLRTERPIPSAA